jgi:hypothetical protein
MSHVVGDALLVQRPCLICRGPRSHPVHGQARTRGQVALEVEGQRAASFGRSIYYFHNYDPGERRQGERRGAEHRQARSA